MEVKGILRICKGIFSSHTITFEDADVSPPVTLERLTQDHHSGYFEIPADKEVEIEDKKQMIVLGGHFRVSGFLRIVGELRLRA